ncbi:MAG: polysaccharide export protein [Clostridia bacterium]|nr:polysaccharide export protein [Clostridia bacterium]
MPRKFILSLVIVFACLASVRVDAAEVSIGESLAIPEVSSELANATAQPKGTPVFGANFFLGKFSQTKMPAYDPNYRIAIGDTVNVRFWGAMDFQADLKVDTLGNIFIPQIGNISVAGLPHAKLQQTIEAAVRKRYNDSLFVYATLANYQPVSVFVTGNVRNPGLYQGMSSDSVLQYLDKAGGIDPNNGSFRKVRIVRGKATVRGMDLYSFLTDGQVELFQFQNGDSIVVDNRMFQVEVLGDATRPFKFEFFAREMRAADVFKLALPKPTATNFSVTKWNDNNEKITRSYPLAQKDQVIVGHGDSITLETDHNSLTTEVSLTGEHAGRHTYQLDRDASLQFLLDQTALTPFSEPSSTQVFRKSVAQQQKQLLEAKLKELETLVLTAASASKDEAAMRAEESKLLLSFIDRARKAEPKGQIVINENSRPADFILEDGDTVYIPRRSNLVLVQGEVAFPGAHTWTEEATALDYISLAGDFSERSDRDKILIIRQNGQVIKCDSERAAKKVDMRMGDAILVMPKLEGKYLQFTRDITQILYQIAVSTGVLLAL